MKKRMYLASETIFEFISIYLASTHFYFFAHVMDTVPKSLKQARNIVLLSHFMSKGLTKLDFALP